MILTIFFYRKNSGWFWDDSRKKGHLSTSCMHNRLKSRCFGEHHSKKVGVLTSDAKSRLFSMLESKTTLFFRSTDTPWSQVLFWTPYRKTQVSSLNVENLGTKNVNLYRNMKFMRWAKFVSGFIGEKVEPTIKLAMFIFPLFYRWKIDMSSFFRATRLTPLLSRVDRQSRKKRSAPSCGQSKIKFKLDRVG